MSARFSTHVIKQLLQVLLELEEVDSGDEALARLGQAVTGQLHDLVVDEAEHAVSQGQHALGGVGMDEVSQTLLHLRRGLKEEGWRVEKWMVGGRR